MISPPPRWNPAKQATSAFAASEEPHRYRRREGDVQMLRAQLRHIVGEGDQQQELRDAAQVHANPAYVQDQALLGVGGGLSAAAAAALPA
eukprot:CAMPEP_0113824308 /NCGR_PEP_ID=MMETSP0328-20130328/3178_1 /TAXON_ID=39455 /ORGANISM="Alexandrium minutum" /LENGTH=89 /DNA_ID=CAMNT_0000792249 /DNA_START=20 /DNA_END=287 /DNA_ORIENTATION=- /assembly_acc=CAM_ASM_000350